MPPFVPFKASMKPCAVPFPFQVIAVEVQFLFLCLSLPFSSYLLLIVCTVGVSGAFPESSPVNLHFVASLLPPLSRRYQCFCVWMCCYFCSNSVQRSVSFWVSLPHQGFHWESHPSLRHIPHRRLW